MNLSNLNYVRMLRTLLDTDQTYGAGMRWVGPVTYTVDLAGGVPMPWGRYIPMHCALAETAWQFQGDDRTDWLDQWAPWMWEADHLPGTTILSAAYGSRWLGHIDAALTTLRKNPDSRRVQLLTWREDDVWSDGQPPCMVQVGLRIRGGKLHTTVHARGQDVMLGVPWNVANFGFLATYMAREIEVDPGPLSFLVAELHLYPSHEAAARAVIQRGPCGAPVCPVPEISIGQLRIKLVAEKFVEDMRKRDREFKSVLPNIKVSRP